MEGLGCILASLTLRGNAKSSKHTGKQSLEITWGFTWVSLSPASELEGVRFEAQETIVGDQGM